MTFSDTEMMELGRKHPTNIHNTRSLIRTLKYVLDILQTEEAFTVEEYKHTHTRTHARTHTITKLSKTFLVHVKLFKYSIKIREHTLGFHISPLLHIPI